MCYASIVISDGIQGHARHELDMYYVESGEDRKQGSNEGDIEVDSTGEKEEQLSPQTALHALTGTTSPK